MTEALPPDDLNHLPKADEGQIDPRAAKAALWREIAAKKKAARVAKEAAIATDPPDTASPENAPGTTAHATSSQGWGELLATPLEELHGSYGLPDLTLPTIPAQPARRRSVIRSRRPADEDSLSSQPCDEAPGADGTEASSSLASSAEPTPEPRVAAAVEPDSPARATPPTESADPSKSSSEQTSPQGGQAAPAEAATDQAETKPAEANAESPAFSWRDRSLWIALFRQKWVQWGGASLSLSLGIHALILLGGGFFVVSQVMLDSEVDFLPGGTRKGQEASQALEHKIQQKKNPWLRKPVPIRKIAAVGSLSDIVLPDEVPDLLDLPSSNELLSSGKLGGSALAGSGFGKGMGLGAKSGMVFQPLSMFGREIKAKRLALVLDVSSSMAPYLPRVIEEVDKVAKGSVIILFPGCGLDAPPPRGIPGKDIFRTSGQEFERFWRSGGMTSYDDARKFKFSSNDPIPNESIFKILSRRPQTYFVHYVGIGYTWIALLSDHVRQADALYWFSDFQDNADFTQVEIVRENLKRRGQKLYIQPYQRGYAFDLVKSQLVDPSGGDVIEAQF